MLVLGAQSRRVRALLQSAALSTSPSGFSPSERTGPRKFAPSLRTSMLPWQVACMCDRRPFLPSSCNVTFGGRNVSRSANEPASFACQLGWADVIAQMALAAAEFSAPEFSS